MGHTNKLQCSTHSFRLCVKGEVHIQMDICGPLHTPLKHVDNCYGKHLAHESATNKG